MIKNLQHFTHQYDPDIRLIVCAISLMCSLYITFSQSWWAVPFFVLSILLFVDVLRNSSIWYGFSAFRNGELAKVSYALGQVRWPRLLSAESTAYYHWLKGVVDVADERYAAAKVHLLVAINGELRTQNDRCLLHCLLAELALQEEDNATAREHLKHASALDHHPEVNRIIQSLEQRMSA